MSKSHVLVIPFPGQGHLNPMLQFSKRLASKGLKVTFVITTFIFNSKRLGSSMGSLQLDTISDGFDDGGFKQAGSMDSYLSGVHSFGPKTFKQLIERHQRSSNPIDCVIYEPFLAWALDIAKQFGLIAAAFFTHTCTVDHIFYTFHRQIFLKVPFLSFNEEPETLKTLIDEMLQGGIPNTSSTTGSSIPGLPLLELQDLPSFIVQPESYPANFKMTMSQFSNIDKADYVLVNTFYRLEEEAVDTMSKVFPLLTIGPTIPSIYLDNRVQNDADYGLDLFEADTSISTNWLNKKPAGSVVYASFGSIANLSDKQIEEIAWGLKRSNTYFLWVVRAFEEAKLPNGFAEEVADKGLMVKWSSQVKILANEAVGCFFTHCGWNSTIEALSLGVPMVTMPRWSDQPTNSKLVQDVWKVGIKAKVDENGVVTREEIEYCIKEVMERMKGREMKMNSKKWKELAVEAVSEGGTSDTNINEFVFKLISSKG